MHICMYIFIFAYHLRDIYTYAFAHNFTHFYIFLAKVTFTFVCLKFINKHLIIIHINIHMHRQLRIIRKVPSSLKIFFVQISKLS